MYTYNRHNTNNNVIIVDNIGVSITTILIIMMRPLEFAPRRVAHLRTRRELESEQFRV